MKSLLFSVLALIILGVIFGYAIGKSHEQTQAKRVLTKCQQSLPINQYCTLIAVPEDNTK